MTKATDPAYPELQPLPKEVYPDGQAYPIMIPGEGPSTTYLGMNVRTRIAMAMAQGMCGEFQSSESHTLDICDRIAKRAVKMADALIEQLNREEGK